MIQLTVVTDDALEEVVDLINRAYRSGEGWTHEADYLDGLRTDIGALRRDLAANSGARLLGLRDAPDGDLQGVVWLEPIDETLWYLGLLTVRPDLQDRRLGRHLLGAAETWTAERGARRIRLTVVGVRDTLIDWYERRGYARTGQTLPFPYADVRFGRPMRDDLDFVVLEKPLLNHT